MGGLFRTALRMTRSEAKAEDLVQETYLRAWRFRHQFKPGTNFRAWIFSILSSVMINTHRRESKAPYATDWSEGEPAASEDVQYLSSDDLDRIGQVVGDEVKKAVDKMPYDLRIVFLLSSIEELTYKEISATVEIRLGTVMSRLFRARAFLRKELEVQARGRKPDPGRSSP
jgi:RNA polymerase sigma-70 factor (ECF subfamily)